MIKKQKRKQACRAQRKMISYIQGAFGLMVVVLCMNGCGEQRTTVAEMGETVQTIETLETMETVQTLQTSETESVTEESFEDLDALIEATQTPVQTRKPSASGLIEASMKYVQTMDAAKYTTQSWSDFLAVYEEIVEAYNEEAGDKQCDQLYEKLEREKSRLTFVSAVESSQSLPFHEISKQELLQIMKYGFHLEETTGEKRVEKCLWRNVGLTTEWFEKARSSGLQIVRISVDVKELWDETETVAGDKLEQLQWIVDQATAIDLFVVISIADSEINDVNNLINGKQDQEIAFRKKCELLERYEETWREVAFLFRDYDEHVIFESMNEVLRKKDTAFEEKVQVLCQMNQVFVNVVRATGSNNEKRWLSTPGRFVDGSVLTGGRDGFSLPKDVLAESRLMVAKEFSQKYNARTETSSVDFPKVTAVETKEELVLTVGETGDALCMVVPAGAEDGILWESQDPLVATVNRGRVIARGIGETIIEARTPQGTECYTTKIIVMAVEQTEMIELPIEETYTCRVGDELELNQERENTGGLMLLQYRVSEPDYVFVNRFGKCHILQEGETDILITDAYGNDSMVHILVEPQKVQTEGPQMYLSLNVLYHDEEMGYQGNEVGEPVLIQGAGQYTVTFDCDRNLSAEAKKAGISSLKHLTAVYIKDYSVTLGELSESLPSVCELRFDRVEVGGQELTLTNHEVRSVVKSSGIVDTNGPLNAWGQTEIEEIENVEHVLDFTDVEEPQVISITFTITKLSY